MTQMDYYIRFGHNIKAGSTEESPEKSKKHWDISSKTCDESWKVLALFRWEKTKGRKEKWLQTSNDSWHQQNAGKEKKVFMYSPGQVMNLSSHSGDLT